MFEDRCVVVNEVTGQSHNILVNIFDGAKEDIFVEESLDLTLVK